MGDLARISISTKGAEEFRALSRRLRQAGRKDLRKKLRVQINDAGRPVLDEVRATVRALPVSSGHGGGTTQRLRFLDGTAKGKARKAGSAAVRGRRRRAGLRSSIASATKLQITARGVRFVVNSRRLPVDQRTLPRHLDSPKGWKHPVFGDWHNGRKPVHQRGKPYFATTIKKRAPKFRQAILDAIDEIGKDIEG